MTQTTKLDNTDDQDVAQLTNFEDSDLNLSTLIEPTRDSKPSSNLTDTTAGSRLGLPAAVNASLDLNIVGASTKRSADDDHENEFSKRVKASHNLPIPDPTSNRTSQHTYRPHLETPPSTSSRPTAQNAITQTPKANADTSSVPFARPAVPLIPIEGIETLQQASSDMI